MTAIRTSFLIFISSVLVSFGQTGAPTKTVNKSLEHFAHATRLMGKGEYAGAKNSLNTAIKIYPKKNLNPTQNSQLAAMYSLRGACLSKLGKSRNAWKDFNKGVKMDPKAAYPLMMRAVAHSRAGSPELARADLKKGLTMKPSKEIRKEMESMLKQLPPAKKK